MKSLLLHHGHILDPGQGIDEIGSLLLAEGKIFWRGSGVPPYPYDQLLEAEGLFVCPGFIDLHCHLRQPGFEEKETMATGTRAAARGGFTTVCCMPNTSPPLDNRAAIEWVKSAASAEGVVRVLPVGCISRGRQGEELVDMGEMAAAGVIAFSDDGASVMDCGLMRQALEYSRSLDLPIIDHCEDLSLTEGGQMNEGVISSRLGLRGIPAVAEEIVVVRDLALAQLTGSRLHIAHVSTEGSVELIRRAKEKGIRVTAEVTPHHLTLTEEKVTGYHTDAKVNPPLRTGRDVRALIQGLNEDVIDIIATDHAPHTEAEKAVDFSRAPFGISGLETAFGALMSLVHGGQITRNTLIAKLTGEPARIIGERYGRLGALSVGAPADVTLFDPERQWVVDTRDFASKGRNTPLAGLELKGQVVATISRGEIVYLDKAIKRKGKLSR